jgi:hypothetical protein
MTKTRSYPRKSYAAADAGLAAIVYLIMAILLSRQINRSRTPAGISRVSRWSFLTQAVVDSICFAGVCSKTQLVKPLAD